MKKIKFIYIFIFTMTLLIFMSVINIIGVLNGSALTFEKEETSKTESTLSGSVTSKNIKHIVVLDAGHGGDDPGAIGEKGTMEKDVALKVTLNVGQILEKKGITVIYTRKDDNVDWLSKNEELLSRARISNKNNADIFVSVHLNSSDYKDVSGTETYYSEGSVNGKRLASLIQSEIVSEVKLKDRGIKYENFSVLKNVQVPSVLLELGYISNINEEYILKNSVYQDKFALAIANGIVQYFE